MSFTLIVWTVLAGVLLGGSANGEDDPYQHAVELLSKHPLIDGYYKSRASVCWVGSMRIRYNHAVVLIPPSPRVVWIVIIASMHLSMYSPTTPLPSLGHTWGCSGDLT